MACGKAGKANRYRPLACRAVREERLYGPAGGRRLDTGEMLRVATGDEDILRAYQQSGGGASFAVADLDRDGQPEVIIRPGITDGFIILRQGAGGGLGLCRLPTPDHAGQGRRHHPLLQRRGLVQPGRENIKELFPQALCSIKHFVMQ